MWTIRDFKSLTGKDRLTVAENKLIEACQAGEKCTLGDGFLPIAETPDRRVRAALLGILIKGGTAECGLADFGVSLHGAYVEGALDLRFAKARGVTDLSYCNFTELPLFSYARFLSLALAGSYLPGLNAQSIVVKGSVALQNVISGTRLDFAGAEVKGSMTFDQAILQGNGDLALNAQGTIVGQNMFLKEVVAIGAITLSGAKIGGQLSCRCASFDGRGEMAFDAEQIEIGHNFVWCDVIIVNGLVSFAAAKIGEICDDIASLPKKKDQFYLNGLTYHRLSGNAPTDAETRLKWLKLGSFVDKKFYPQPYTQLAKVMRDMGHDADARTVLAEQARLLGIERRKPKTMMSNNGRNIALLSTWTDLTNSVDAIFDLFSRVVAGYGHKPMRSLWCLLFLWFLATALAQATWTKGSFAPNSDVVITSQDWIDVSSIDCVGDLPEDYSEPCIRNPADEWSAKSAPGMDWDSFNAFAYGADLVIPILDLGQTDAWAPSKDRGDMGWWLWWLRWPLEGAGWLVTALGVAAITGIMQRNQPGA